MLIKYEMCSVCLNSEYKGDGLWFCTKYKKECNELWNSKFDCKKRRVL